METVEIKALKKIKICCELADTKNSIALSKDFKTVYKALQRDIPKHPIVGREEWGLEFFCPCCEVPVNEEQRYCVECGQHLTFEEDIDE